MFNDQFRCLFSASHVQPCKYSAALCIILCLKSAHFYQILIYKCEVKWGLFHLFMYHSSYFSKTVLDSTNIIMNVAINSQ